MVSIKKRGQAALEFLTTYGWAFLVILVMISALGYFGILNPDRFLPERCNVGPEFACVEYAVFATPGSTSSDNANLLVILTNNIGQTLENMTINQYQVRNLRGDFSLAGDECNVTRDLAGSQDIELANTTIRAGENIYVKCNFRDAVVDQFGAVGSKVRIDLDIQYNALGAALPRPLATQVYATLQE